MPPEAISSRSFPTRLCASPPVEFAGVAAVTVRRRKSSRDLGWSGLALPCEVGRWREEKPRSAELCRVSTG